MAKRTVETKFWEFDQNYSGGRFVIDDESGIGPRVWVEALSRNDAIDRALRLGIYFDGCSKGMDCFCCGDRWSEPWDDEGKERPEFDPDYAFNWHTTVYVHHIDGKIERIGKGECA